MNCSSEGQTNKNRWNKKKTQENPKNSSMHVCVCERMCVCMHVRVLVGTARICRDLLGYTSALLNYTASECVMRKKSLLMNCTSGTNSTNLMSILSLHGQTQDLDVETRNFDLLTNFH